MPVTSLLLLADTHVPARARVLPEQVWRAVDDADIVVHAGDWVEVGMLEAIEARATEVIGVHGNNDDAEVRRRLPEIARETIDGIRIAVVHETGASRGREERCEDRFPGTDLLVFGHSHIPWDTTSAAGLRLLNPGSPTDRRRQPTCTYMTAQVESGVLTQVGLIPVER
ncbi:MAG TPA: metallophosphoesterase [Microbacteriaceae bacterium]|nr:metallophosphoesterase [Microbacteriaceae bacterium]